MALLVVQRAAESVDSSKVSVKLRRRAYVHMRQNERLVRSAASCSKSEELAR